MKYIVDSNMLISHPEVLKEYEVVITSHVLREIERLELEKKNDSALQREIMIAKDVMDECDFETFDLKDYRFTLSDKFDPDYVDNILIQVAVDNGYGIITDDKLLRQKCKLWEIPSFTIKDKNTVAYEGYKFVEMTDEEMSHFYGNLDKNMYDLLINQYIIIRDTKKKTVDKYRWDGKKHVPLNLPRWKSKDQQIKPLNDLQECALDMLSNPDIPIKFILGTYGSGKTFLTTKVALHDLEDMGGRSKIMMVRNPIGTGVGIGYLSGNKQEKTDGFFKPIIQHLDGGEQTAERMEDRGELIREIPYYMKGLSIEETFMIIDEAEDLSEKEIKLIGTRMARNTVAAFCGDINQAEGQYVHENGIVRAINSLKGKKEVGIIVMDIDERSVASRLFAEI